MPVRKTTLSVEAVKTRGKDVRVAISGLQAGCIAVSASTAKPLHEAPPLRTPILSKSPKAIAPKALRGIRDFLDRMPTKKLPGLSRIILFGSHARGDFEEDSDVDLAIVLQGMPTKARQRMQLVLEMSEAVALAPPIPERYTGGTHPCWAFVLPPPRASKKTGRDVEWNQ